jgi:hypothetical protein
MPRLTRIPLVVSLVVPGVLSAGCDGAFSAFEGEDNLLHVLTTHHPTQDGQMFPNLGGDELPRIFENDLGWKITLSQAYAVTTAITLVGCNNETVGLDMYWGPCAEDMNQADLDTMTVAGARLDAGSFCKVVVQYSPYDPNAPSSGESKHLLPSAEEVVGASVFLNGYAEDNTGQQVGFTLRSTDTVLVERDLSTIEDGGPLTIAKDNFPEEITVSKTYDRFFDGVDFNNFSEAELSLQLIDILGQETRISYGALVSTN